MLTNQQVRDRVTDVDESTSCFVAYMERSIVMIERFERFSTAISEISYHWHKIASDEMEKHGLKGPYAVYFTTLHRYPDGITAAKLAEICSKDKADVSRALALLQKLDLVKKEGENYRASIKLTEKGRQLAEVINQKAMIAVENGSKGCSEEEREIFYMVLELIRTNLEELSKKGL